MIPKEGMAQFTRKIEILCFLEVLESHWRTEANWLNNIHYEKDGGS